MSRALKWPAQAWLAARRCRASQALNGSNWAWLHAAQVLDKPTVCRVLIRLGCAAQVLDEPGLLTPTQSTRLTLGGSGAKAQSSCCG